MLLFCCWRDCAFPLGIGTVSHAEHVGPSRMLNAGAWDHIRILISPHIECELSILVYCGFSRSRIITLFEFNRLPGTISRLEFYTDYPCASLMLPRGASRYLRGSCWAGSLAAPRRGGSRNRQDLHGKLRGSSSGDPQGASPAL